jgi:hypothetical protein
MSQAHNDSASDTTQPWSPVEVFYSYSHKDEEFLDKLITHLSLLKRKGVITGWHDRQIGAGVEWKNRIDEHLESAGVILLLVSADFLASDYCYDLEMARAMARHHEGTARVIPIILRKCDWSDAPFGELQALPKNAEPVKSWADQDEAFTDIATGIKRAIAEIIIPDFVPGEGKQRSIMEESGMETLFINSFPEYCAHCAKMMSRATGEVRTVQTPSRVIGELIPFREYLSVTADKIVRPSGSPTFGVTLYRRLVVVSAASFESESKKLSVFFEALRDALDRAHSDNVRDLDLSCLGICIVHRETMARFFHSNLDVHITAANECAVAFQRPQAGREGDPLWQTCLYARLGTQSNVERLVQSFDQVWEQGSILGGEVQAESIGPQAKHLLPIEHIGAIEHKTLAVLRKIAFGHIDLGIPENSNVRRVIERSAAYSNRFFRDAKRITVQPQVLAPLVREWHAITRAFALKTPQYVALIAKECQMASGIEQSKRFERALQIASSISAGEFGIGVPLSNQIHFRLFSELSSIVGITPYDLHREREGTWQETKAVNDLFERSFADLRRGAGVLCTIEVTAFHIVDAMSSLFQGRSTGYVDLHLEIEQSHAELADELCNCIRTALEDEDDSEILQGANNLCDALGRFWDRMAAQVFQ